MYMIKLKYLKIKKNECFKHKKYILNDFNQRHYLQTKLNLSFCWYKRHIHVWLFLEEEEKKSLIFTREKN
jgi:hypothetical protein